MHLGFRASLTALIVGAGLAVSATAAAALAQAVPQAPAETGAMASQPTAIQLYQRYEAALEAGDLATALSAGQQAWALARTTMPETSANRAALAYNAAWIAALAGSGEAIAAPAAEAVANAGVASGAYDPALAGLLVSIGAAEANPGTGLEQPLIDQIVLQATPLIAGSQSDLVVPTALTRLSWRLIGNGQLFQARRLARLATDGFDGLNFRQGSRVGQAYLALAVASTTRGMDERQLRSAVRAVNTALEAVTGPGSAPGGTYHSAVAWRNALMGLAESDFGHIPELDAELQTPPWLEERNRLGCKELERARGGAAIGYPSDARREALVGGALIRIDVAGDGRVTEAEVLASLPSPSFGEAAAAAVRTWRYQVDSSVTPACRQDYEIRIVYALE
jgi:TonB family protein